MKEFTAILVLIFLSIFPGCSPDLSDDPIPYQPFNEIVINLSLPTYNGLKVDGGFATTGGGIRGIIIYRLNSTTYLAYERNCSYHPKDACATVDIDVTGLYLFDPCCGSTFNFSSGVVLGGIAWRPLRKYHTLLDFNELTITDEVL
jgi:hypothetical protein